MEQLKQGIQIKENIQKNDYLYNVWGFPIFLFGTTSILSCAPDSF